MNPAIFPPAKLYTAGRGGVTGRRNVSVAWCPGALRFPDAARLHGQAVQAVEQFKRSLPRNGPQKVPFQNSRGNRIVRFNKVTMTAFGSPPPLTDASLPGYSEPTGVW